MWLPTIWKHRREACRLKLKLFLIFLKRKKKYSGNYRGNEFNPILVLKHTAVLSLPPIMHQIEAFTILAFPGELATSGILCGSPWLTAAPLGSPAAQGHSSDRKRKERQKPWTKNDSRMRGMGGIFKLLWCLLYFHTSDKALHFLFYLFWIFLYQQQRS